MKTIFRIIGAVCFIASIVLASFFNFSGSVVIEIALASFGLASIVVSAIKDQKEKGSFSWLTVLIIALAIIGGALCCIGGLSSSIFEIISGAVLSLIAIIIGIIGDKKAKEN